MLLSKDFYQSFEVLTLAQELLGKVLITRIDGVYCSGIIVETEAYRGPDDKACHAYNNRLTERTKGMYKTGGHSYIYICYGYHHLFNVITAPEGNAHAILIRAVQPLEGIEVMLRRRSFDTINHRITKGPGSLSQAMGIHKALNGVCLFDQHSPITIEDQNISYRKAELRASKRIGVEGAGDAAHYLWRYFVNDNPYVSGTKSWNTQSQAV